MAGALSGDLMRCSVGFFPRCLPRRAHDKAAEFYHRHHQHFPCRAVDIGITGLAEADADIFLAARDVERPEHPVPQRKHRPVILVEMLGRGAVVDLVLRRADENMFQRGAKRNPQMRMAQIRQHEI